MSFLTSRVTTVLIIINVVIFLLETKDGGSTNREVALKYGAQYQPLIRQGQYYRLFTAMFLHFGAYHLLFNMYALSVIGPAVDYVCGPAIFLIVYLGAGLAGNIATMILDEKTGRSSLSAGRQSWRWCWRWFDCGREGSAVVARGQTPLRACYSRQ